MAFLAISMSKPIDIANIGSDEEKQSKKIKIIRTPYALDTTICKQTQIT